MLMKALFALVIVVGLIVVWILFLRSTRERWELAVVIVGTGGLLVLMLMTLLQSNTPVLQTSAIAAPGIQQTEPPVVTQEATEVATVVAATPSATSAPSASPLATTAPTVSPPTPTPAAPTSAPTPRSTATLAADATPTVLATQTSAASTPTAGTESVATVGDTGGNIRSAPAIEDNIIGFVDRGDEVIVIASFGEWYLVRLGSQTSGRSRIAGGEGWIVAALIGEPSQTPPEITPIFTP